MVSKKAELHFLSLEMANKLRYFGFIRVLSAKEKWNCVDLNCLISGGLLGVWQRFIYRRTYKKAIAKYPEHRIAILSFAAYKHLLKGL